MGPLLIGHSVYICTKALGYRRHHIERHAVASLALGTRYHRHHCTTAAAAAAAAEANCCRASPHQSMSRRHHANPLMMMTAHPPAGLVYSTRRLAPVHSWQVLSSATRSKYASFLSYFCLQNTKQDDNSSPLVHAN